jgi:hypothetical protein
MLRLELEAEEDPEKCHLIEIYICGFKKSCVKAE